MDNTYGFVGKNVSEMALAMCICGVPIKSNAAIQFDNTDTECSESDGVPRYYPTPDEALCYAFRMPFANSPIRSILEENERAKAEVEESQRTLFQMC